MIKTILFITLILIALWLTGWGIKKNHLKGIVLSVLNRIFAE